MYEEGACRSNIIAVNKMLSNSAQLRHVEFATFLMMFSTYTKLRIVFYFNHLKGIKAPEIEKRLLSEGMTASRRYIGSLKSTN